MPVQRNRLILEVFGTFYGFLEEVRVYYITVVIVDVAEVLISV